jgi:hypothetical protein
MIYPDFLHYRVAPYGAKLDDATLHHRRVLSDDEENDLAKWLTCGLDAVPHNSVQALKLLNEIATIVTGKKVCFC